MEIDPRYLQKLAPVFACPVKFARGVLGSDIWGKQCDVLVSVQNNRRTAVKACHASGKTYIIARAVLWWIATHPKGIVVTTAPTWEQVKRIVWGEIKTAVAACRIPGLFPTPLETEIKMGPGRYAIGISTNEGVRFQGFHGDVLVVLDEAPGVMDEIWQAIEGIMAGGDGRILAMGNPTMSSGPFYDAFTANRELWHTISIGAFDSPNLAGVSLEQLLAMDDAALDHNPRPYLTTRRWVRDKYYEWGPSSPEYQARVLGKFATSGGLILLSWIEAAAATWRATQEPAKHGQQIRNEHPIDAGVDVADGGTAETVLCVRQGQEILHLQTWTKQDTRGDMIQALAPYRQRGNGSGPGQLRSVNVDCIGVGANYWRHLADAKLPACPINVGLPASNKERFANLKAEWYWGLRERFEKGEIFGDIDPKTIGQLAGLQYESTPAGKTKIESKLDAKGPSPDRAEAIMLAFGVSRKRGRTYGEQGGGFIA